MQLDIHQPCTCQPGNALRCPACTRRELLERQARRLKETGERQIPPALLPFFSASELIERFQFSRETR